MMKLGKLIILLSLFFSASVIGQSKNTIALFNLTPISIGTIGLDGDLLFGLRSELGMSSSLAVIPRRQMEEDLYRIGGAQVADTLTVVKYGREIGADYVFTGTIDEEGGRIVGAFKLVDVVRGTDAATWTEYFSDSSKIAVYSNQASAKILQTIQTISTQEIDFEPQALSDPIVAIEAQVSGHAVSITWQIDPSLDVFFYNVYRAKGKNDSFEFLTSVQETQFSDNDLPSNDNYFYRIGIALNSGEELESAQLVSVAVNHVVATTSVSPPIIIGQSQWLNGLEIEFTPSIASKQAVEGYRIYQKDKGTKWNEIGFVKSSTELEYRFSYLNQLIPDVRYEFAVTAVATDGAESELSSVVALTTQPHVKLMPDNTRYLRRVKVTWSDTPENAKGVNLYRRNDETQDWKKVAVSNSVGAKAIEDQDGLEDGQRYQYSVSFFDDKTESALSGYITAFTKDPFPPPEGFAVRSGVKSNYLEWEPIEDKDVKGYVIYRNEGAFDQNQEGTRLAFVTAQATQFVDGVGDYLPLKDGQHYHYTIATVNQFDGQGPIGLPATATTKPRPSVVTDVIATANTDNIALEWKSSPEPDIKTYHIYRRWNDEPWTHISEVSASETAYVDDNLKPYAKTFFRVISEDADALKSDESSIAECISPAKLKLNLVKDNLLREISLAWNKSENIDGYRIYRRLLNSSDWTLVEDIRRSSTTQYVDRDARALRDGLTYEYKVTAYDKYVETEPSNLVQGKTKPLPDSPLEFSATSNQVKEVTLNWQTSDDQDVGGYKIYLVTDDERELLKTINSRSTNRYVDTWRGLSKLKDGTNYTYAISAFNTLKVEGAVSQTVSATTKPVPHKVVGLTVNEEETKVTLYWDANTESDIDYYEVYRGNSCANTRRISRVDSTSTRYIDDSTSPERNYCYKIRAVDNDGLDSDFSDTQQVAISAISESEAS